VSVFDQRDHAFHFHEGPVFTNVLLADEINRASPRTQSALLEAMAEGQVSSRAAPTASAELFFVIATQNPVEFRGTYPLPEAQMDRFAVQLSLGYVPPEDEVAILSAQAQRHPIDTLTPCVSIDDVLMVRRRAAGVPHERRAQALRGRRSCARRARRTGFSSAPARAPRSR